MQAAPVSKRAERATLELRSELMNEKLPKEVLVVEDEPLVRMAAADTLVDRGIMAWEAGDATEALHLLEEHPRIGVVFTDINMPGRPDGLGLAHQVIAERPGVELIVTSGAVQLSDEDLPDDGVFLSKPYTPERLVDLVERKLASNSD
jgi:DNA-binding NtrC family response regulator